MPRYIVSISEIAPRTTGIDSALMRIVIDLNGFSISAMSPSTRRTATANLDGARIMTPSMTA